MTVSQFFAYYGHLRSNWHPLVSCPKALTKTVVDPIMEDPTEKVRKQNSAT